MANLRRCLKTWLTVSRARQRENSMSRKWFGACSLAGGKGCRPFGYCLRRWTSCLLSVCGSEVLAGPYNSPPPFPFFLIALSPSFHFSLWSSSRLSPNRQRAFVAQADQTFPFPLFSYHPLSPPPSRLRLIQPLSRKLYLSPSICARISPRQSRGKAHPKFSSHADLQLTVTATRD